MPESLKHTHSRLYSVLLFQSADASSHTYTGILSFGEMMYACRKAQSKCQLLTPIGTRKHVDYSSKLNPSFINDYISIMTIFP